MINQAKAAAAEAAARAKAGVTTAKAAAEDVLRRRRVAAMTDAERAEVRAVFDRADTLRRGRVDAVEVRRALHELSGQWMPDDELATFWAELVGPEGATTIGFDEFLLMLGPTMFPPKSVRMLQAATSKAREAAKPLAEQATERAASLAHGLSDTLVTKVLDAVRKSVTADALDPDMPRPLRKAVSYAMTAVLADVEIEVREKLLGLLHGKGAPLPPPEQRSLLARLVHGCRAGLLYTLRPHDKTMWVQLRNPAFLLLKLVSVFPLYGVQPAFFLLTFLLIDKGDEYQLVDFILMFKGSQFVSIGLISTILGAAWYFSFGCQVVFPGENWAAMLFVAQMVTVWLAFALLPFSREKGRPRPKEPKETPPASPTGKGAGARVGPEDGAPRLLCGRPYFAGRGGRLRPLLAYEALTFLLCLGLVATALGLREPEARLRETIYWARTLYGLLAFPFALFVLPVVGGMLTHALPTAYDPHGRCVPLLSPSEMRARRAERLAAAAEAKEKRRDGKELRRRGKKGATIVVESQPAAMPRPPAP